jgi:hypothetical protein
MNRARLVAIGGAIIPLLANIASILCWMGIVAAVGYGALQIVRAVVR